MKRSLCISSVHFIAAIITQRSVFCTLSNHPLSVPHNLHRIPSRHQRCLHHIIRQYQCANTLGILCVTSVQAIHNGRQKLRPRQEHGPSCCISQIQIAKYIGTYLLTPWSRVLLEKLTGSAASQGIPRIFATRRFITVLTSSRHLSLS